MLPILRSLFRHQAWADAAILDAVRAHPGAAEDDYLRRALHHIVTVQRFFVFLIEDRPFDYHAEDRRPAGIDEFEALFRETHDAGIACVDSLATAELDRALQLPSAANLSANVGEALIQVVMHSQHHRAQCASRLRSLGATPPAVDYILWLQHRDRNAAH